MFPVDVRAAGTLEMLRRDKHSSVLASLGRNTGFGVHRLQGIQSPGPILTQDGILVC